MENISSQNETAAQEKEQPVTKEQKETLAKKQNVIARLEALISDQQGDLTETITEFRNLQNEWKEAGDDLPQANIYDLQKEYYRYQEQFYDLIKINNELRDYDFKKNLELKTQICEKAEELAASDDTESAHKVLQKLYNEWRELGPVAKELREEIWNRFKTAADTVKEKRAEAVAAMERLAAEMDGEIREEKEKLCVFVESIATDELKSRKSWEKTADEVKEANKKFLSRRLSDKDENQKMFDRMRSACDKFFEAKSRYFADRKAEIQAMLDRKREIVKIAEGLKDSTEWRKTTDKIIAMQKEWWALGMSKHKTSVQLMEQFKAACDHFFNRRKEALGDKKGEERRNLEKKREIIGRIEKFELSGNVNNDFAALKALQEEFRNTGFVPFKEKEKLSELYGKTVDKQYDRIRAEYNIGRTYIPEKDRLIYEYERLKQEIATYENNMGFFANSKKTDGLVKDMERKLQKLRKECDEIFEKINSGDNQ